MCLRAAGGFHLMVMMMMMVRAPRNWVWKGRSDCTEDIAYDTWDGWLCCTSRL